MAEKTKKLQPDSAEKSQMKELSKATGGGMVQNSDEHFVEVGGKRYVIYKQSYLAVRYERGAAWLCVWNEINEGEPNLMIRL